MYRGQIKNGLAVPDTPIPLPDGTPVRVEIDRAEADDDRAATVEELAAAQGVGPISSLSDLLGDWPAEDSVDEFLALVREVRR